MVPSACSSPPAFALGPDATNLAFKDQLLPNHDAPRPSPFPPFRLTFTWRVHVQLLTSLHASPHTPALSILIVLHLQ